MHAAAAAHGVAVLHVVLAEGAEAVELREHDGGEVGAVLAPELAAAERDLGEAVRLLMGQSGTAGSSRSAKVPRSRARPTWCVSPMGDRAVTICSSITPSE